MEPGFHAPASRPRSPRSRDIPDSGSGATCGRRSAQGPVGIEFGGRLRRDAEEFGATPGDPARSVVSGHFKLLERGGRYELAADPHELADRGAEDAPLVHSLAAALPTNQDTNIEPREGTPPPAALGRGEADALRALGYLRYVSPRFWARFR